MPRARSPRIAVVVIALVAVAGGGSAAARSGHAKPAKRNHTTADVSAAETQAFAVLSQAPVATVPAAVTQFAAASNVAATYAPDVALTRAVETAGGGPTIYVIPGTNGLCFYASPVGHCSSIADAESGKLFVWGVRVPPLGQAPTSVDGPDIVIGVAPDGYSSVASSGSGGTAESTITNNVYEIQGTNIQSVSLAGGTGSTVSFSLRP